MRYSSTIQLNKIEKFTKRDGFSEAYHKVMFDLISEGIPLSQIAVWVHPAYPEEALVRVAQTFAWSRLHDFTEATSEGAFSEEEIQSLWQQVKPLGMVEH